MKLGLQVATKF